jgi:pimeloyl-ACP methyl ester carboxylesterase
VTILADASLLSTDVLWLNTSPHLKLFDQPLLRLLSHTTSVAQWEYQHSPDEASSLSVTVELLHNYLNSCHEQPVHLVGHSTGGLLGLLYASQYPEKVKSLTLLAVGFHPAIDWKAHYYVQRQLLSCSRQSLLTQIVSNLFGSQNQNICRILQKILEKDLDNSASPHSLFQRVSMAPMQVSVPLLVCGSRDDIVIDLQELQRWRKFFKSGDRLWECLQGGHFFHYFYPRCTAGQITDFWLQSACESMTISRKC